MLVVSCDKTWLKSYDKSATILKKHSQGRGFHKVEMFSFKYLKTDGQPWRQNEGGKVASCSMNSMNSLLKEYKFTNEF